MSTSAVPQPQDDLSSRLSSVSQPAAQPQADDLTARLQGMAGTTPIKMVGPKGQIISVPQNRINEARQSGFMVSPDHPGAQRMVDSKGQATYALPDEIENFENSGHRPVDTKGNFTPTTKEKNAAEINMNALAGMTNMPTPNMSDEQKQEFRQGQQKGSVDALKDVAYTVAGAKLGQVLGKAGNLLSETEAVQLFKSSPKLYAEYLLNHPATKDLAIQVAKKVGTGALLSVGFGGGGAAIAWLKKVL